MYIYERIIYDLFLLNYASVHIVCKVLVELGCLLIDSLVEGVL